MTEKSKSYSWHNGNAAADSDRQPPTPRRNHQPSKSKPKSYEKPLKNIYQGDPCHCERCTAGELLKQLQRHPEPEVASTARTIERLIYD